MALTDEGTGTTMLVQPSNFGGSNGFGDGFGGSGWWILLLFLLVYWWNQLVCWCIERKIEQNC